MFNEEIITISFCETYHEINGKPLYSERYDKVLSYHNGIAPVYSSINNEKVSFFINKKGERLYNRIFLKTFGFYDNIACVMDKTGYYHINIDGVDLYKERYKWCGNFNEGACAVCDIAGNYFHIDTKGNRLYAEDYTYVGDYKYGVAVAVLTSGKSIHIFKNGSKVHNNEYKSLQPFHKGYAVAEDNNGFFHINKQGEPLYDARYLSLEPFYNDKAYATDFYGNLIVLDYNHLENNVINYNEIYLITNKVEQNIKDKIACESFNFFDTKILASILELGVFESILKNNTLELNDLALDNYVKELIISWLQFNNYINKSSLTKKGVITLEMKPLICYWQTLPYNTSCLLTESLKNNKEYFTHLYDKRYFEYIKENEYYKDLFSFISNYYATDYKKIPFSLSNETVCDLGCGSGYLLYKLKEENPHINAIYTDLQDIRKYKTDTFIEIDFLKDLPSSINADIYIISRILHDYNDIDACKILSNISKIMNENSKLYIFETIRDNSSKGVSVSFHLLNLLGGRERNYKEFQELINKSGLKINKIYNNHNLISILEVIK